MLVKPFQPAAGQKGSGVTPRSATPQCDTEVQLLKPKPVPEVIYPLPSLRNTRLWSNISRSFPTRFTWACSGWRSPEPAFRAHCLYSLAKSATTKHYLDKMTALLKLTGEPQRVWSGFYVAHRAQLITFLRWGYCCPSAVFSVGSVVSYQQEKEAEGSSMGRDKHLSGPVASWTFKKGKWKFEHE